MPKEGGNRFTGQVFANFATEDLQADNLDDDLKARGLTVVNNTKKLVDFSPSFGGPIPRSDRLWFYGSFRSVVTDTYVGGLFYNQTPTAFVYTPDPNRPAVNDQRTYSSTVNVTYQMSSQPSTVGLRQLTRRCVSVTSRWARRWRPKPPPTTRETAASCRAAIPRR